ncbi:MAG: hypothetical protein AB9866_03105 [Syntrophobacteraceae bacterium]
MSSRINLGFDVVNSPSLSPEQKELILRRLSTRISKEGILRVISQQTRSQAANKELAIDRFVELMRMHYGRFRSGRKHMSARERNSAVWRKRSSAAC